MVLLEDSSSEVTERSELGSLTEVLGNQRPRKGNIGVKDDARGG